MRSTLIKLVLFSLMVARAGCALADFTTDPNCATDLTKRLSQMKFGNKQEDFDTDTASTACEGNSAAAAASCIKGLASQSSFKKISAMGLSTLCSGGTSAIAAAACLRKMAPPKTADFVTSVDSCTGIAHQAQACLHIDDQVKCASGAASGAPKADPAALAK